MDDLTGLAAEATGVDPASVQVKQEPDSPVNTRKRKVSLEVLPPQLKRPTRSCNLLKEKFNSPIQNPKTFPFECDQCAKRCKNLRNLREHKLIHSAKFKCGLCGKAFRRPNEVGRHKIVHSGDPKFPCKYCNCPFNRKAHCTVHEKTCEKRVQIITAPKVTVDSVSEKNEFDEAHPQSAESSKNSRSEDKFVPVNPPISLPVPEQQNSTANRGANQESQVTTLRVPKAEPDDGSYHQAHLPLVEPLPAENLYGLRESISRIRQLQPDNEDMLRVLSKATAECKEVQAERVATRKQLQSLAHSMGKMKNLQEVLKAKLAASSTNDSTQLENSGRNVSESRRAKEVETEIQELIKKLERATECRQMNEHLESDSSNGPLQAEVQELRKALEIAGEEKKKLEMDRCQHQQKLQLLSTSLATFQDSQSRRTRELHAENRELRRKLEEATEENGKIMEERRKSLMEQLAGFSQRNEDKKEDDGSRIVP